MKAIILISSIFYIIGLKIGNNIDLSPAPSTEKKTICKELPTEKNNKPTEFNATIDLINKPDSVKNEQTGAALKIKRK
ncbi:MAG TPA: hypothetical protein VKA10_01000 [Prolixibacteraceae bacterium]|nr:hypothetical protein [Prolixibacteraceae bacterium]